MTEDLINNKDIYFPSYFGTNDKLITLLNRASQTLCEWFSKADKNGPLPLMRVSIVLCLRKMVILKKICFLRLNLF